MITKEQALAATYRQNFYGVSASVAGKPITVRVSGKCQTWKSNNRQHEFRLPVKYGLYENGEIDETNNHRFWTTAEERDAFLARTKDAR